MPTMKTIKIYGSPKSSAGRVYWTLEELGIPYERVPLNMSKKEHKADDFIKLNPNGKIPCLVDGDLVLWESMAINTYLAEKYDNKGLLKGQNAEEVGRIAQWSYWSILELQKHCVEWLIQEMFMPVEKKDPAIIEKAQKAIAPLMAILNAELANKTYLACSRFTLADLNTASVVSIAVNLGFSIETFPAIKKWLMACQDRPAWHKVCSLPL